jgi:hypothetical protein
LLISQRRLLRLLIWQFQHCQTLVISLIALLRQNLLLERRVSQLRNVAIELRHVGQVLGGDMPMNELKFSLVIAAALMLSGCSSMNVFRDSPAPEKSASVGEPDLEPAAPDDDVALNAPTSGGTLSAAQIRKALSGKSWKWTSPSFNGVTLYADDGSSLIEVTGKGTTTGKWEAKDGQLCESVAPAPFLPKGQEMRCRPMSGSGNKYKVGQANFTLA